MHSFNFVIVVLLNTWGPGGWVVKCCTVGSSPTLGEAFLRREKNPPVPEMAIQDTNVSLGPKVNK